VALAAIVVGQITGGAEKTPPMCMRVLNGKYAARVLTRSKWIRNIGARVLGTDGWKTANPSANCLIAATSTRNTKRMSRPEITIPNSRNKAR